MKLEFLKQPQLEFLREGKYIQDDETPQQRFQEVVDKVREYESTYSEGLADRIAYLLDKNILSLSTPVLANFGKKKDITKTTQPLSASCYIVTCGDSISDIYDAIGQVAMASKLGGGVGSDFQLVSQKGTKLSEGFYSNSKLDWIEDSVGAGQKVSQSSIRRGYNTPFISIEDNDFDELMSRIDKKNPNKSDRLINNTVGIILPIGFRDKLTTDKEAQRRYIKVITARKETGRVYMMDVENSNINSSVVYKKLGLNVSTTNICCVTGDQMVATEEGFKTVKELSDSNLPLRLFDNESVHNSTAMLYRGNADVYKITLSNGMEHIITSNHELVVRERNRMMYQQSIDTGLEIGKKVCIQTNKGLFGKRSEPGIAFLLGLFLGDGNHASFNSTQISIWENDFDLISEIEEICEEFYNRDGIVLHHTNKLPKVVDATTGDSNVKKKKLITSIFNNNGFPFKKGEVPFWILDADEETQSQFLRGLLYADGTVGDYNTGKSFGQPISVSLVSIDRELLKMVQLVTVNMGLNFKIYKLHKERQSSLPKNDGTGDYALYKTKKIDRLILSNKNDLLKLEEKTGFLSRKKVFIENRVYRDNSQKSSKIVSIKHLGKKDVYCPTVDSDKHLWVCNGLITSNTEFLQPLFPHLTSVCVISALNLVYWDEIKDNPQYIKDAFMFLDIVNEEYIKLSEGIKFLEKAHRSAIEKRDIGLGALGFAELLQIKGFAYGDVQSRILNKEIFSTIRKYGEETTFELGEKLGSPLYCQSAELVRRNCSLMMVAPNKSTCFISGATSGGSEPFMSNIFLKSLAKIQYVWKNPHLIKLLESKGKNNQLVWDIIQNDNGSVEKLDFLTQTEKDVFKTFTEVSPKDIIDLASDRQVYIDMGQSLNLIFRKNYTMKDIYDIHKYAWSKGIKTLYYAYNSAHAALEQDGGKDWDNCVSCAD
jgi:ribonucleoside-diphosphate reductase alpha chain